MQRGITKSNRLEANSSPIAEPSVKAVSLKRNKMRRIFTTWIKTKIEKKDIFGFNTYMITDDEGTVAITKRFNADIITACPEMLEALKEIDKFAQDEFPIVNSSKLMHGSPSYDPVEGMKYDIFQRILTITREAIAKAEGK